MGIFYNIPWDKLHTSKEIAVHAVETALMYIEEKQPCYAALGGPMLFIGTDRAKAMESLGVKVLQVAGDEVFSDTEDVWCNVFNAMLTSHHDTKYIKERYHLSGLRYHYTDEEVEEIIKA